MTGSLRAAVVGSDAALVSAALGFMYALLASAPVGPQALPLALLMLLSGFVVGGLVQAGVWRGARVIASPNTTGVLILAGMLLELQRVPALQGSVAAGALAIVAATVFCGLLQLSFGALGLGSAMRFLPFPVVAGFTNTVAASLVVSMAPAALGHDFMGRLSQAGSWFVDMHPGALVVAMAGTAAGIATRRLAPRVPATVVALAVAAGVHHALAAWVGPGWLGPVLPLDDQVLPTLPGWAEFTAAAAGGAGFWEPVIKAGFTLAVLNSLFSLLTVSGMLRPNEPALDGNALLKSLGVANLAAGLCVGLPVAVVAPSSTVVRRSPVPWVPVLAVHAGVLMLIFLGGHTVLRYLPLAAVASAVFTAASAMFDPWTLRTLRQGVARARLEPRAGINLAVSLAVTVIGLLSGLANALSVGMLAAVALLAFELRRKVLIHAADGRQRRSRRVRPAYEHALLDQLGAQVRVVELGHWLYFGSVDALGAVLDRDSDGVKWLVLDLHRVSGIDVTAARALWMASQRLAGKGVRLVLAGLPEGDARRAAFEMLEPGALALAADADEALEEVEDALLNLNTSDATVVLTDAVSIPGLTAEQQRAARRYMEVRQVRDGQRLYQTGDPGDAFYLVVRGRCSLWLPQRSGPSLRLSSFGPGQMFGYLELLDGDRRSSDARADSDGAVCVLTRQVYDSLALTDRPLREAITSGLHLMLVKRLRDTTRLLQERG